MKTSARNLMICLLSFPNTGALPLIFIGALEEAFNLEAERTGEGIMSKETFEKAVGFIMLNACIQTLLRWSIGYDLMRKPANPDEIEEKRKAEKKDGGSELMVRLQEIINPTLISSLIAIIIGSIPFLKGLLYVKGGEAPLYNTVFKTILMIGANGKLIMTLQLGSNLASILDSKKSEEDGEEQLTTSDYIMNVVLKILLYPFVAIIVVMPLLWTGFMYDPMQSFVAMLQIASPSAITLTVITNIHKFLEKETSKCFLYQYIVSVVTLTLASAFFLMILF